MFHSNQQFRVSCTKDQLKDVVQLALNMRFGNTEIPGLAYQIVGDKFVVGHYFKATEEGWSKFMFDNASLDFIVAAITQFVNDHPSREYEGGDGSHKPGYIVELVRRGFASEWQGIKNPWYGIFTVRAYNCFYHK